MSTPQIPQGFTVLQRRMAPSGAYLTACEGECARCKQRIVIDVSDDGTVITQSDDVNMCIHCCILDDKKRKAEKRERKELVVNDDGLIWECKCDSYGFLGVDKHALKLLSTSLDKSQKHSEDNSLSSQDKNKPISACDGPGFEECAECKGDGHIIGPFIQRKVWRKVWQKMVCSACAGTGYALPGSRR